MTKSPLLPRREFIKQIAIGSAGLVVARSVLAADLGSAGAGLNDNGSADVAATGDTISQGFQSPPATAKPQVWWHWMDRNVSKEGITADLEALHRNGLGGAQFFNLDYEIPTGSVQFLSPEWFDAIHHAAQEADRLGLEIGMHNCSGWSSSGGPWITPDHAMQLVTTLETRVKGPVHFNDKLTKPEPPEGKFPDYYRDIAVFASPTPAAEVAGKGFRIPDLNFKAGYEKPQRTWAWRFGEEGEAPADAIYRKDQIIDVSRSLKADGTLTWDVPEGDWTIIRIGYAPRPRMNTHPEVPAGRGLEVDKMSRAALDIHFKSFIDRVVKEMGPLKGKSFTNLLIDSYEVGAQNWTPQFREEFQRRRGYDLLPYLITLTGCVVDSVEITERFLWDFRRTIADLYHDNYWGYYAELCRKYGLKSVTETYEGPFSTFDNAAEDDIPMTEFWSSNWFGKSSARSRLVASAAHLEGKPIVGAESFTSNYAKDRFTLYPYALKGLGDFMFCDGINRFYFHDFTHQPWVNDAMKPGMTMGPWGLHFARTVTWWEQSKAWMTYIGRCQYLLQSGHPTSDILCFTGESGGVMAVWKKTGNLPPIPDGYDFEFVNAKHLLAATVQDGRIVLRNGLMYRVLVLPDENYLSLAIVKKLAELVKVGATIVGPAPNRSPSLSEFGTGDSEIRKIAAELWGNCDGKSVTEQSVGPGRVFWGKPLNEVLGSLGIRPDFDYQAEPSANICYKHRAANGAEIYFVCNQSRQTTAVECKFRVSGKLPELWHADSGLMEPAPVYDEADGITTVPLQFDPSGSVFVVFRQPAAAEHVVSVSAPTADASRSDMASSYQLTAGEGALILSAWAPGNYEVKTSKGRKLEAKVQSLPAPKDLNEDWGVAFPPKLGDSGFNQSAETDLTIKTRRARRPLLFRYSDLRETFQRRRRHAEPCMGCLPRPWCGGLYSAG